VASLPRRVGLSELHGQRRPLDEGLRAGLHALAESFADRGAVAHFAGDAKINN
jgi:hypothetical protein